MPRFTSLKSRVIPLLIDNIDTDQIIPARFLKSTEKTGLGGNLFADWRYESDGSLRKSFALNNPLLNGAAILLAGDNFGCGSSREHAPWALTTYGFKAIISTSFADIFRSNALKNGLLPVSVSRSDHEILREEIAGAPLAEVIIDLQSQRISYPSGRESTFPIDTFSKFCLLNGVDELEYLLRFTKKIEAYERALAVG